MDHRILLFLLLCLPVRIALVWAAKKYTHKYPVYFVLLGLGIAVSFLRQYRTNAKSAFGGNVFWDRRMHAVLFFGFAATAWLAPDEAYTWLAADVLLGTSGFVYHRLILH